jgi:hypothetical protein
MTNFRQSRTPTIELGLVVAGLSSAVVAALFDASIWLALSLLICIVGILAAGVTLQLSKLASVFQVGALTTGIVGIGFGSYWWSTHRNEPDIFSPIFLGYFSGAIAISAAVTLTCDLRPAHGTSLRAPGWAGRNQR